MPYRDFLAAAFRRTPRALFASRDDPRFSYCLALPSSLRQSPDGHHLLVAIHGSSRGAVAYRDGLADFAERERCVVLAPLFPVGPLGDGNGEGYKFLTEGDIRYDAVLLAMIAEVEGALGHRFGKFLLSGYSGGGQFAHRFLYLHPDRLRGVSIGAPGAITRIDPERDYWLGTRDWAQVFRRVLDTDAMRDVPVQILVGENDTKELGFGGFDPSPEEIRLYGRTRLERSDCLRRNLETLGLSIEQTILPGVGHEGLRTIDAAAGFFARLLASSDRPAIHYLEPQI